MIISFYQNINNYSRTLIISLILMLFMWKFFLSRSIISTKTIANSFHKHNSYNFFVWNQFNCTYLSVSLYSAFYFVFNKVSNQLSFSHMQNE